ncbi:MAG: M3 family oligoendopeptidase [Rhabdochlamydiaceae bacterium]|nr:M3 family oligoendopeptidase [Candidatus Amphrikana amoebophyrae]
MIAKDRWELDSFFNEEKADKALNKLQNKLIKLKKSSPKIDELILTLQEQDKLYKELESYIICLMSENTKNKAGTSLFAKSMDVGQHINDCFTLLDNELKKLSSITPLLKNPKLKALKFFLTEKKEIASKKLSQDKEEIINALQPDGFHGLMTMYDHLKNQISIPSYDTKEPLSYPEAENCLSNPNRHVRRHTHQALTEAFEKQEDLFGEVLNHIAGFRLKTYELRGWNDFLEEPLTLNRISKQTLNTMFSSIDNKKKGLLKFMEAKAKLLHIDKLSWYDLEAPISELERSYTFSEGAQLILEVFGKYSEKLQDFALKALSSNWVEAEERKNKRAGGFCTSFPLSNQTRIFMNYKGTFDNVTTLAHELGHSFHADVTFDLDLFNQDYPMNLAETASTMCEQMLLDSMTTNSMSKKEKLLLFDKKVSRHATYLMNLPARFYFETSFYEERKKGFVEPSKITELMVSAQNKAFDNALDELAPQFWASKMHFYFTDYPFYNFPYTFGYLFSLGTYLILMDDPKSFEKRYIDLLKDTGRMTTEDLAKKHLGVDLKKPKFFERALAQVQSDIDTYLQLASSA